MFQTRGLHLSLVRDARGRASRTTASRSTNRGWSRRPEPGALPGRRPAVQPLAEEGFGRLESSRAEISSEQRLLEDVALRVAAAQAQQLGQQWLEEPDGRVVVAVRE